MGHHRAAAARAGRCGPAPPRGALTALLCAFALLAGGASATPSRVASLNLCTDSLLFELLDDTRIVSVTTLSLDPNLSPFAARAARLPVNHGTVEEVLARAPDLVVTDEAGGAMAEHLLGKLGIEVLRLPAATRLADYRAVLSRLATRLGAQARAADLLARLDAVLAVPPPVPARRALVYQPNGFTQGSASLMHELLSHAGLLNVASELGLEFGGYLDLEQVLRAQPEVIVFSTRHVAAPSLAESQLEAPALRAMFTRREAPVQRLAVTENLWTCAGAFNADAIVQLRAARR